MAATMPVLLETACMISPAWLFPSVLIILNYDLLVFLGLMSQIIRSVSFRLLFSIFFVFSRSFLKYFCVPNALKFSFGSVFFRLSS